MTVADKAKIKIVKRSETPRSSLLTEVHRHTVALARVLKTIRRESPDSVAKIEADVAKEIGLTNAVDVP